MIGIDFKSAEQYAAHLATYIASPTKIEDLVKLEYDKAPPLHKIAQMRYEVEQAGKPRRYGVTRPMEGADNDDIHWQPATFVPKVFPKREGRKDDGTFAKGVSGNPRGRPAAEMFAERVELGPKLIASVARDFAIAPQDIAGGTRGRTAVHARAVVAMVLKHRGWSYPRIARAVGRTDHSTIIHAVQMFETYCRLNPTVTESFQRHAAMLAPVEAVAA